MMTEMKLSLMMIELGIIWLVVIRYKKNTGVLDDPVNDFERLCNELSISGEDLKIELFFPADEAAEDLLKQLAVVH